MRRDLKCFNKISVLSNSHPYCMRLVLCRGSFTCSLSRCVEFHPVAADERGLLQNTPVQLALALQGGAAGWCFGGGCWRFILNSKQSLPGGGISSEQGASAVTKPNSSLSAKWEKPGGQGGNGLKLKRGDSGQILGGNSSSRGW